MKRVLTGSVRRPISRDVLAGRDPNTCLLAPLALREGTWERLHAAPHQRESAGTPREGSGVRPPVSSQHDIRLQPPPHCTQSLRPRQRSSPFSPFPPARRKEPPFRLAPRRSASAGELYHRITFPVVPSTRTRFFCLLVGPANMTAISTSEFGPVPYTITSHTSPKPCSSIEGSRSCRLWCRGSKNTPKERRAH